MDQLTALKRRNAWLVAGTAAILSIEAATYWSHPQGLFYLVTNAVLVIIALSVGRQGLKEAEAWADLCKVFVKCDEARKSKEREEAHLRDGDMVGL